MYSLIFVVDLCRRIHRRLLPILALLIAFSYCPKAHGQAIPFFATIREKLPPEELQALLDLYNSTDGPHWTQQGNWTNINTNDWYGVRIEGEEYDKDGKLKQLGHVTLINRGNNGLRGLIPSSIGNLKKITYLALFQNNLSGPIPDTIGSLKELEILSLSENSLSGPIPEALQQCEQLKNLGLESNQLNGGIPSWIGSLAELVYINLSYNKFVGEIPASITNLENLTTLVLGANELVGSIPDDIGNLSELTRLEIYKTLVDGPIPASIGRLGKLQDLILYENALTGEIPASIGDLPELDTLALGHNQLTGGIPVGNGLQKLYVLSVEHNALDGTISQNIGRLKVLDTFHCSNNALTGDLPQGIGELKHLYAFICDNNRLTGNLPAKLGEIEQLHYFIIGNNQLTGPIPPGLEGLTSLEVFDVSYNSLSGPIPAAITSLPQLRYLNFTANELTGTIPPNIAALGKLQFLGLASNQLSGSIPANIGDLSLLTILELYSNQLSGSIPSSLSKLPLSELNLSMNALSGSVPSSLESMTQLRSIDLSQNQLSGGVPFLNAPITQLWTLNLSSNSFQGTIPSGIGLLANLTSLDLSQNSLSGSIPPAIGNLSQLGFLSLARNGLTGTIPGEIGNLSSLRFLDLSGNSFEGEIPENLWQLTGLYLLDLGDNQLVGELSPAFGQLDQLFRLSLGGNRLSGLIPIEIGELDNLQFLDLSRNQFRGAVPDTLSDLTHLGWLNLSANELSGALPGRLTNLNLWWLSLDYNRYSLTDQDFLQLIEDLENRGVWVEYEDQKTLVLSMHRVRSDAITNVAAGQTDIDAPLELGVNTETLATQPAVSRGLVADGVTPLLFRLKQQNTFGVTRLAVTGSVVSGGKLTNDFVQRLRGFDGAAEAPSWSGAEANATHVIATIPDAGEDAADSETYASISGILPEDVELDPGGKELLCELTVQPVDANGTAVGAAFSVRFTLRKPPIVLIHGYFTDTLQAGKGWPGSFLSAIKQSYPSDFIVPVSYGTKDENTTLPFTVLVKNLDRALARMGGDEPGPEDHMHGPFAEWAYTRYDVVCHSQGGIVARMLCSQRAGLANRTPFGTVSFRNSENFYRGRFRRIVTIGTPHNGSRLLRYALQHPIAPSLSYILQDKFDPFGSQIRTINAPNMNVDPAARFHLLSTTIAGGLAPGYSDVWLFSRVGLAARSNDPAKTVGLYVTGGRTAYGGPVDWEHGGGSDGIVDVVSQQGGGVNNGIASAFPLYDVPHADFPRLFNTVPGQSQNSFPGIAAEVRDLLRSSNSAGDFGTFRIPPLLDENTRAVIDGSRLNAIIENNIVIEVPPSVVSPSLGIQSDPSALRFALRLAPSTGNPVSDVVTWFVEVYGTSGITADGVTVSVDPSDTTKVTVEVADGVKGDIVVNASYQAANGSLIVSQPVLLHSIPIDATLTGIALSPKAPIVVAGESLQLQVNKLFSDGSRQPALLFSGNAPIFSSSAPDVVSVQPTGRVNAIQTGTATLSAMLNGFTSSMVVNIVAPGLGPVVNSSDTVVGVVGQPFSFQVEAVNSPTTFLATGLPPGLSMNSSNGVISGIPKSVGTFTAALTVDNETSNPDHQPLTISIGGGVSFPTWQNQYFTPLQLNDPRISGVNATPQNDGIANILKYAFGLDPSRPLTGPEMALLPTVGLSTSEGNRYLTITYGRNYTMSGVELRLESSPDLSSWQPINPDFEQDLGTDQSTGNLIMRLGVRVKSGENRQFLRLNAITP